MAATTMTAMGSFYDEKLASSQLSSYRTNGPIASTRALIETLVAEGVAGATLLDIGGGVGAIQHELLDAGASHATSVDASSAYLEASREEGRRRGHNGRVTYLHGDFVDLADSVPPAEIVTLDRVINVYPDWERLAGLAAARATRLFGLVYPRDTRLVGVVVGAMNVVLRLKRAAVRASIPSGDVLRQIAHQNGLELQALRDVGPAWRVVVYGRPSGEVGH